MLFWMFLGRLLSEDTFLLRLLGVAMALSWRGELVTDEGPLLPLNADGNLQKHQANNQQKEKDCVDTARNKPNH